MQIKTDPFSRRRFLQVSAAAASVPAIFALTGGLPALAAPEERPAGPSTIASDASPRFRAVAEAAQAAMAKAKVPGFALAIYSKGRQEIATFGVTDLVSNSPITQATRFQMASINKTYTATAAMRLVEDGRLDLDRPVRSYLPELRLADENVAQHVTIRHLVTHTSGWWGDRYADTGDGDDALARFISEELPILPQLAPLGSFINYNNTAFMLLGRIIEVTEQRPYREALQRLILDPLDLASHTFESGTILKGSYARGHSLNDRGENEEPQPLFIPRHVDPAGGLWTDVVDLVRYGRAQLGEGPQVLELRTMMDMRTPQKAIAGMPGASIGLSWIVKETPKGPMLEHSGGSPGQSSMLQLAPHESFAMAVLTNSDNGGSISQAAKRAAAKQYLGASDEDLNPTAGIDLTPLTDAALAEYAGTYTSPGDIIKLTPANGRLVFTHELPYLAGQLHASNDAPLPTLPMDVIAGDTGLLGGVADPMAPVPFLRRPDGSIGWLSLGFRLAVKQR